MYDPSVASVQLSSGSSKPRYPASVSLVESGLACTLPAHCSPAGSPSWSSTILDAATGTGRHVLRLARRGIRVTGIDQSPEMLAMARASATRADLAVELLLGSLDNPLPFAEARFDLVICALALCHVQNLRGAIREFARVLRPGGAVIISDFHPYCVGQGWRAALFGPGRAYVLSYPGHSRDDYLSALEDAGLQLRQAIDASMGEAPCGTMLDEEREGGRDIPFCLVLLAVKPF